MSEPRLSLGELADLLVSINDRAEAKGASGEAEGEADDDESASPSILPAPPRAPKKTKPPETWTVEEKRRVVAEATQLVDTPFMKLALHEGLPFWQLEAWCREFGGPEEAGRSRGSEMATVGRRTRRPP